MRNVDEETITQAVLASFAGCQDERLRILMTSLVQHLHSFVREVQFTESEWFAAIRFLTSAGHITDDRRQEFILLSDTLGMSMLVTALSSRKPKGCTESTVFGPFFVEGAPEYLNGADIARGAKGEPCWVSGTVADLSGRPIADAVIDVWQADEAGFYDTQYPDLFEPRARGRLRSCADGTFRFKSIVASAYPIPHDGPVGKMLGATGRHPWRPAHLHFMIAAAGFKRLITHVFRSDDQYLDSDAVFGVRCSLVADWERHPAGKAPDGSQSPVPFYTLDFNFVLDAV
ncbi:MAG TPA: intradiol ring-cleavage dioxygenase [Steroidobacteraceae bacterium]|jgi:hydroxyquinol 1,2-dioxygenase